MYVQKWHGPEAALFQVSSVTSGEAAGSTLHPARCVARDPDHTTERTFGQRVAKGEYDTLERRTVPRCMVAPCMGVALPRPVISCYRVQITITRLVLQEAIAPSLATLP